MIDYCESKKKRPLFDYSTLIAIVFASYFTIKTIESKKLLLIIFILFYWMLLLFIVFGKTKFGYVLAEKIFPKDKRYRIIPYDFSGIVIDHESKKVYFGERGFLSTPLAVKYNLITQSTYTSPKEDCIEIKMGRAKRYLNLYHYKDNAQEALRVFFIENKEYAVTIEKTPSPNKA